MEIYLVGGAVRDRLLGLPVQDRDYVVVGATPEAMEAQGFLPVGRDFPVFLHPETHEEYALARTERKNGRGYRGFVVQASPEVSLREDLARRDLTINAMAEDAAGQLIDPFGGQQDLAAGLLRHVSDAFVEDPVRVLRLARFAARFGFQVAPETERLMQRMVADGEVAHLVPERIWAELSRALMEAEPWRFFSVLHASGALAVILPELVAAAPVITVPQPGWLAASGLNERTAALGLLACLDPERLDGLLARLRAPSEIREFTRLAQALYPLPPDPGAAAALDLLERADALRRPERFRLLLAFLARFNASQQAVARRLAEGLDQVAALDAGAIARRQRDPGEIKVALRKAREDCLAALFPRSRGIPDGEGC